jgi:hypothetical protein
MYNSETQQMQNRQPAAPEILTFHQLEQVAGGLNIFNFGPHVSGGGYIPPMPPIGPVGPILPIGPGPLALVGPVMGLVSN